MKRDKITKGFLATKDGLLVQVKVSIHDVGFYVVVQKTGEPPQQHQRKYPGKVDQFLNELKTQLEGYNIKDLGEHYIYFNKQTGVYRVAV